LLKTPNLTAKETQITGIIELTEALENTRRIAHDLLPPFDKFGLHAGIEELC
jgi:signal transduction histidine kinase